MSNIVDHIMLLCSFSNIKHSNSKLTLLGATGNAGHT